MKSIRPSLGLVATIALSTLITVVVADEIASNPPPAAPAPAVLARGDYLVHRAGLCIDCHSPRNEKGEFLPGKALAGAPIGFKPLAPMPWMTAAPRLAGGPAGFSQAELVHFLMTGERPGGRPPALPPMPAYRFDRADAEAIAVYLQSLPVTGGE
jgi:mono/diheme cytochrome c family protein